MEHIETLQKIYDEIESLKEKESELLKQAQIGAEERKMTLREQEVDESIGWYEVFNLGADCEAGKILTERHPEVFAASKATQEKFNELKTYAQEHFQVDPTKMSMLDVIKLIKIFS